MTKKAAALKTGISIEVRVLVRCAWGNPNDVATVTAEDAEAGRAAGELDSDPQAVAYAKSLLVE